MPFNRELLSAHYIVGRTAVMEAICYPADMIIEFISYPIAFMGYFFFIMAMFEHGSDFGGYSVSNLITYFSIGWLLRMIFDQGTDDELAGEVQSGDVALSLVRPMSLEAYLFSRFVGLGVARMVYYGIPASILLALLFGGQIQIEPLRLLWFIPYALIAFCMAFEFQYFLGILSFFLIMNQQISWSLDMLVRLVSGLIVPLYLFPGAVAFWLELLPFQYLYYRPIQALLEPGGPWRLLGGIAVGVAWLVLLRLANQQMFALALRRHVIYGS